MQVFPFKKEIYAKLSKLGNSMLGKTRDHREELFSMLGNNGMHGGKKSQRKKEMKSGR